MVLEQGISDFGFQISDWVNADVYMLLTGLKSSGFGCVPAGRALYRTGVVFRVNLQLNS
jgi:hypothetical protein